MGHNHHRGEGSRAARAGLLLACAAVGLSLTGCGPLASQLEERAASAAAQPQPSVVMATPSPDPATAQKDPAQKDPSQQDPAQKDPAQKEPSPGFTLAANQEGMPAAVQEACALLLSRTTEPIPPAVVGECIAEAMQSGGSYQAVLETKGTSLPGGSHSATVRTGASFAMRVENDDAGTVLETSASGGSMDGRNGTVRVDAEGGPDERSAAIVAHAASVLLNPEVLKGLLASASSVQVGYAPAADADTEAAVRLTGFGVEEIQGVDTVSLELVVDARYRPVRLDILGMAQSIPATTSVSYSAWGAPVDLPAAP